MIPVVFIHWGKCDYLRLTIRQSHKYNILTFLLGDDDNKNAIDGISDDNGGACFAPFKTYWRGAQEFDKVYVHQHRGGPEDRRGRLFHYQRWFAIRDFMAAQELKRVFVADSDVGIYSDVRDAVIPFDRKIAALAWNERQDNYRWAASGHSSYWTIDGLRQFCDFMTDVYTGKEIELLNEKWNYHKEHNLAGGVCDMTLLHLWRERNYHLVGNILEPTYDDISVFDDNLNVAENYYPDEYEMEGGIKKIEFNQAGEPYVYNRIIKKPVRFNAIHFQGPAKQYISKYLGG